MLNGFCPSYDNPVYLYPEQTKSQLKAKHTQFFRANYLCRALKAGCWAVWVPLDAEQSAFFPTRNRQKKSRHFKWKAGKQDGAKKGEFTPESGNVDTYGLAMHHPSKVKYGHTCQWVDRFTGQGPGQGPASRPPGARPRATPPSSARNFFFPKSSDAVII